MELGYFDTATERFRRLFLDPLAPVAGLLARVRDREDYELIQEHCIHDEIRVTLHLRTTDLVRIDARPAWCRLRQQLDAANDASDSFFEIDTATGSIGFVVGNRATKLVARAQDGIALASPSSVTQLCAQLSVHVVGVDQLDAVVGDVLHALLDLLRPRALPFRIERFIDEALVELVGQLLPLLRRERQQLVSEFRPNRHAISVPDA
jgi:hypothetical protein